MKMTAAFAWENLDFPFEISEAYYSGNTLTVEAETEYGTARISVEVSETDTLELISDRLQSEFDASYKELEFADSTYCDFSREQGRY